MLVKWELTMRGRMLAILASLALCGAWITGDRHACLAAAVLLSPLLIDRVWKGRGVPELRVNLAPRRTQSGQPFLETLHLHNPSRRSADGLRIAEQRVGARSGVGYVESLAPGDTVALSIPSRTLRRGVFGERMFVCETTHPLGILSARRRLVSSAELVSEPARISLPRHLVHSADASHAEPAPHSPDRAGEFHALRDYRYGEDLRTVHALRSAATGSLIAVDTRSQDRQHPCLVLDLRRPPAHGARRSGARFEWSLSAAATLIDEITRAGGSLVCLVLADKPRVFEIDDGVTDDLMTCLAMVRPRRHCMLDPTTLGRIEALRNCYWVPAGGYSNPDERRRLRDVVLITPGPS